MKKKALSPTSIFTRLFLTFLVIMIPFEVTGIIMFTWGQNTIQKEIQESATSQVHFLKKDFETQIKNISAQLENLISDRRLNQFSLNYSNLTTSEFYISLREQLRLIETLPDNFLILDDTVIYYSGFDKALSANHGYITIPIEMFSKFTQKLREYAFPIKSMENNFFIGMMYPVDSLFKDTDPHFLINMVLSKSGMKQYLSSFSNYDTVLYNHSSNTPVYGTNTNGLTEEEYSSFFGWIDQNISGESDSTIAVMKGDYFIITEYSSYLNSSLIQFVPVSEIMSVPRHYNIYLILFTIISMSVLVLFALMTHNMVNRPINSLLDAFGKIELGNFNTRLKLKHQAKEFKLLIEGFNRMAKQLDQTIDQLYKQEIYSQRMELKQLQMQINPHFLYNSYFILHRLISQEDLESAKLLSTYMGKYFQYITRNGLDKVPLSNEWEHAVNYIKIQEIRYSIRISVKVDTLPEEDKNFLVPRLILQPILENAFEHGLKGKIQDGLLELKFIKDDDFINIQISDNGEDLTNNDIEELKKTLQYHSKEKRETTALINIHNRLQLEYGKESGIFITSNIPSGLVINLKIQKTKNIQNEKKG